MLGHVEDRRQFPGPVAQDADRAADQADGACGTDEIHHHERGIDRRIEKAIEVFVGEGLPPALENPTKSPAVAAKHQQSGSVLHPRHRWHQRFDRRAHRRIADIDDIGLLQIAFRGSTQRAGCEQPDQIGIDCSLGPSPVRCLACNLQQLVKAFESWRDRDLFTESRCKGLLQCAECVSVVHGEVILSITSVR